MIQIFQKSSLINWLSENLDLSSRTSEGSLKIAIFGKKI